MGTAPKTPPQWPNPPHTPGPIKQPGQPVPAGTTQDPDGCHHPHHEPAEQAPK